MDTVLNKVGFIAEHNPIQEAIHFKEITENVNQCTSSINEQLICYLSECPLVFSWMGYFISLDDNSLIAPMAYYSDGLYVWPSYTKYYLEKYSYNYLHSDFLIYLEKKNYQKPQLSKLERENIENVILLRHNGFPITLPPRSSQ
ncbi:hypothetical protein MHTCC0001_01890 [Flavobacteriaceae bacterium MHTCC 0001]